MCCLKWAYPYTGASPTSYSFHLADLPDSGLGCAIVDVVSYFRSLTAELSAVKDRVRDMIGNAHWPSDGGWKESVLRSVLRRYLPSTIHVGSGFIVSENGPSTQIDVLISDHTGPVLFRDGDFVILTPAVVLGAIEVKTRPDHSALNAALKKLDDVAQLVRNQPRARAPFFGLFAFEQTAVSPIRLLATLKEVNGAMGKYPINCVALGTRKFVRYWEFPPRGPQRRYLKWHAYELDDIAYGYFVHNVIESIFPDVLQRNREIWYPIDGKESRKVGEIARIDDNQLSEVPNSRSDLMNENAARSIVT